MTADELRKRFPWASECFIKANADPAGVCAQEPEHTERMPLVSAASGKEKSSNRLKNRYRITFRCFARRPCDWDNYRCKELQDLLIKAGFVPGDDWNILEGCIVSYKAKTKAEERTIVEIEPLPT